MTAPGQARSQSGARLAAWTTVSVGAALALVACAPGSAPQSSSTTTSTAIATTIPSTPVTLNLTHYEVAGQGKAIDDLVAAYKKIHPNVTINTSYTAFADYGKSIKLQMSAPNAPDIAEVGQAWTMQGPLVQAGLLKPLDAYASTYGWQNRFKPGLLDESRFSTDGKKFGTGNLYGLALGGNMVGIYYNRDKLAKLGLTVPFASLDEFSAALAKAKARGELPIELGNLEAWPGNHLLSSLMSQYQTPEELRNLIFGKSGSFDNPGTRQAATTLADWSKKGYIDPAANATANEDGVKKFIKGSGVFLVGGSWAQSELDTPSPGRFGFTSFPPAHAGDPIRATGATTSPFSISARSKNADVAANFLDFATAPDQTATVFKGGYLPVSNGSSPAPPARSAQEGTVSVYKQLLADDGLTTYLDWSTPSMGDTLFPAVQKLIGGTSTPDQLISAVQQNYSSFLSKQK